jgi:hypothetical protein
MYSIHTYSIKQGSAHIRLKGYFKKKYLDPKGMHVAASDLLTGDRDLVQWRIPRRWGKCVPPKHWLTLTGLHDVTLLKVQLFDTFIICIRPCPAWEC